VATDLGVALLQRLEEQSYLIRKQQEELQELRGMITADRPADEEQPAEQIEAEVDADAERRNLQSISYSGIHISRNNSMIALGTESDVVLKRTDEQQLTIDSNIAVNGQVGGSA